MCSYMSVDFYDRVKIAVVVATYVAIELARKASYSIIIPKS